VLGRVGPAPGIAATTVISCRAEPITGQTLVVDGGMPGAMNFGWLSPRRHLHRPLHRERAAIGLD